MHTTVLSVVAIATALACSAPASSTYDTAANTAASATRSDARGARVPAGAPLDTAIFAAGCFWCVEPPFDKLPGVVSTTSGYTSGRVANPTYDQVSAGGTGHTEGVQVVYDPALVSYDRLLHVFWRNVDPFAVNAQFCDRGDQYRSGIYPRTPAQRAAAEASLQAVAERFPGQRVATEIVTATRFYPAEAYHQDYYRKNPIRYKFYRSRCGRDARLEAIWGAEAGG